MMMKNQKGKGKKITGFFGMFDISATEI